MTDLTKWQRRSAVIEGSIGFHSSFHPDWDEWKVRHATASAYDDLHGEMRSFVGDRTVPFHIRPTRPARPTRRVVF